MPRTGLFFYPLSARNLTYIVGNGSFSFMLQWVLCFNLPVRETLGRSLKPCFHFKTSSGRVGMKLLEQHWICSHDGLFSRCRGGSFPWHRSCSNLETGDERASDSRGQKQRGLFSSLLLLIFFALKPSQKSWISLCMRTETKDEKQGTAQLCSWWYSGK